MYSYPRELTDCLFFYFSTCKKGDQCKFRHDESIKGKELCQAWALEKCFNKQCPLRHIHDSRDSQPCYYEARPSGCTYDGCPYLHRKKKKKSEEKPILSETSPPNNPALVSSSVNDNSVAIHPNQMEYTQPSNFDESSNPSHSGSINPDCFEPFGCDSLDSNENNSRDVLDVINCSPTLPSSYSSDNTNCPGASGFVDYDSAYYSAALDPYYLSNYYCDENLAQVPELIIKIDSDSSSEDEMSIQKNSSLHLSSPSLDGVIESDSRSFDEQSKAKFPDIVKRTNDDESSDVKNSLHDVSRTCVDTKSPHSELSKVPQESEDDRESVTKPRKRRTESSDHQESFFSFSKKIRVRSAPLDPKKEHEKNNPRNNLNVKNDASELNVGASSNASPEAVNSHVPAETVIIDNKYPRHSIKCSENFSPSNSNDSIHVYSHNEKKEYSLSRQHESSSVNSEQRDFLEMHNRDQTAVRSENIYSTAMDILNLCSLNEIDAFK